MPIRINTAVAKKMATKMKQNAIATAANCRNANSVYNNRGNRWDDDQSTRFGERMNEILPTVKDAAIHSANFSEDLEKRIKELGK